MGTRETPSHAVGRLLGVVVLLPLAFGSAPSQPQEQPPSELEDGLDMAWFGYSIVPLGDWNGDGAGDFLVGAPREMLEHNDGHWEPQSSVRAISGKDGKVLFRCVGPWRFGASIAIVGDLNGDGKPEWASGSRSDIVCVCSGADGTILRSITSPLVGVEPPYYAISTVASLGDVDGDGSNDIAVSWCAAVSPGPDIVALCVYSGASGNKLYDVEQAEGRWIERVFSLPDLDGDGVGELGYTRLLGERHDPAIVNVVSGKTGIARFSFVPQRPTESSGLALSPVGDITGDGIPELALGASEPLGSVSTDLSGNPEPEPAGELQVFSGHDGSRILLHTEEGASAMYGHAVFGGADLDGDGVPDYVVTEYEDIWRKVVAGKAWIYSGKEHTLICTIEGKPWEEFGASGAMIGDVDRDGVSDFAIGCMNDQPGSHNPGRVLVYSGRSGKKLYQIPEEN